MDLPSNLPNFKQLYENYVANCPVAPYTWYLVLGFFTILFFLLWRRAAHRVAILRAVDNAREDTDTTFSAQDVLHTIRTIQSDALSTIRGVQSEAINKFAAMNTQAMEHTYEIVKTLTSDDDE
jgi:hypothetical protein